MDKMICAIHLAFLHLLKPIGGLVAVLCGHIARRRLDIQLSPQKRAIALAGLIIGYALIIATFFDAIFARLVTNTMKGS